MEPSALHAVSQLELGRGGAGDCCEAPDSRPSPVASSFFGSAFFSSGTGSAAGGDGDVGAAPGAEAPSPGGGPSSPMVRAAARSRR